MFSYYIIIYEVFMILVFELITLICFVSKVYLHLILIFF